MLDPREYCLECNHRYKATDEYCTVCGFDPVGNPADMKADAEAFELYKESRDANPSC